MAYEAVQYIKHNINTDESGLYRRTKKRTVDRVLVGDEDGCVVEIRDGMVDG